MKISSPYTRSEMMKRKRTVIIGIDGVPFSLMKNLSDDGTMDNFASLVDQGSFVPMRSSIPEISNVSWSSVITGKNPGEHGVYGFTELIPGTYSIMFPDFRALKSGTFWQENPEKKYVIINLPSTYPAGEINGVLISGFVSPDLNRAVYPESLLEELQKLNYRIDVDSEKAHRSYKLFLDELFEVLEIRRKTYRYFWDYKWDLFFFVITGSDRLEHFLWNAYEDESSEYHEKFIDYFRKIDEIIGEIVEKTSEDDQIILLSDHGMEGIRYNVNLNTYLSETGFLNADDNPEKRYRNIKKGTKAFVLDPGRVYLNKTGKYPNGTVTEEREEEIIDDLISCFKDLKKDGENVFRKIYRKKEIYHGKFLNNAPDLVLMPNKGYNLRGGIGKKDIFTRDIFEGKHTYEDAFLYVRNGDIPENVSVEDIRKIIGY